jgi:hypothetical protein
MNARVRAVEVEEVIGNCGILGVNWAGRKMVQFNSNAGLTAGNT